MENSESFLLVVLRSVLLRLVKWKANRVFMVYPMTSFFWKAICVANWRVVVTIAKPLSGTVGNLSFSFEQW